MRPFVKDLVEIGVVFPSTLLQNELPNDRVFQIAVPSMIGNGHLDNNFYILKIGTLPSQFRLQ